VTLGAVLARRARAHEKQLANPGICIDLGAWNYFFPMRRENGTITVMMLSA
jgi:hypothetical protein